MEILDLFRSEYLSIITGGLGGIITAWLTQRVMNKRGLFSYYVNHNKIGMSANDNIFGNIEVTWNDNQINHLYLSTIEVKNESLNDYDNVIINIFTGNTKLLSESTQILGTPNILQWTDEFNNKLHVNNSNDPSEAQISIYNGQREYTIPVFNRGQVVRISYLNSALSEEAPEIWLSSCTKGVKTKFRPPQNKIYGVSTPQAALAGVGIGAILLLPIAIFLENSFLIAGISMTYGFIAQIPGAYFIRATGTLREFIGG